MQAGLPLVTLKICVHRESDEADALDVFRQAKVKWSNPPQSRPPDYDVFISYAREDHRPVDIMVSHLTAKSLKVFMDRQTLSEGAAWQPHVFAAIDRCRKLVALYSSSYVASKICQEEFNIAWARGRRIGTDIILPIYWESADLPTFMDMLVYTDCRERQEALLESACARIVDACASQG
jgi:hypothetical protein